MLYINNINYIFFILYIIINKKYYIYKIIFFFFGKFSKIYFNVKFI